MHTWVRLPDEGEPRPGQQVQGAVQLIPPVEVVLLGDAQEHLPRGVVGQGMPHPHGVHPLGDGVEDLLPAEGLLQDLLTGDPVEEGDHHGVPVHHRGGQGHGVGQVRGLHGEDQQLRRPVGPVGEGEVAFLPVAEGPLLPIAVQPVPVGQEADAVRPQVLHGGVAEEDAHGPQADDGDGVQHGVCPRFSWSDFPQYTACSLHLQDVLSPRAAGLFSSPRLAKGPGVWYNQRKPVERMQERA